jgi:hypothetical protein
MSTKHYLMNLNKLIKLKLVVMCFSAALPQSSKPSHVPKFPRNSHGRGLGSYELRYPASGNVCHYKSTWIHCLQIFIITDSAQIRNLQWEKGQSQDAEGDKITFPPSYWTTLYHLPKQQKHRYGKMKTSQKYSLLCEEHTLSFSFTFAFTRKRLYHVKANAGNMSSSGGGGRGALTIYFKVKSMEQLRTAH